VPVVRRAQSGCKLCAPSNLPLLMDKLAKNPKAALITIRYDQNTGDLCDARAHHGFNGIEPDGVGKIGAWIGAVKTCAGAINPGKALGYDA